MSIPPPRVAPPAHRDLGKPLEGVLWMLASGLSFVGVQGIVRALGTDLPAAQSAFLRYFFGLLMVLPFLPGMLRQGLPAGTAKLFIGRGIMQTLAVLLWFYAMARIPVAQVTAIGYLSPVILMVGGALLLGEGLSRLRIAAVAVAVCGALIVLRPGVQVLQLGHLSQIGSALCFATSYMFAKKLSDRAPASLIVAMMTLSVTIGMAPLAALDWKPFSLHQAAALAVVAGFGTMGHYLMTRAFKVAPMAVTQPVTFLQLVWATTLGAVAFGEPVDGFVLLGGGMIIAAISAVTWAEWRRGALRGRAMVRAP